MPTSVPIDPPGALSRVRRAYQEFLRVPTAIMLALSVLAVLALWLDRSAPGWIQPVRGVLETHLFRDVQATNAFLGMTTSGLITIASITFSMLLIALQQSAALIGAQTAHAFLLRRRNQVVLGFILAATLFTLIVHAGAHEGFNPVVSATLAVLLLAAALYCLAVLLFMAVNQMRPQAALAGVRTETLEARRRQRELLAVTVRTSQLNEDADVAVTTTQHGYVRDVDLDLLRDAFQACKGPAEIEYALEIGDFVAYGDTLGRVRAERPDEARRLAEAAREALRLDYERATWRDPAFGVEQLHMAGWSSGSTAYHNPGVAAEAVRNLRDLLARWTADPEDAAASAETLPVVYPDALVERVLEALEAIAVVATESLQPATFEEVLRAYHHTFAELPPALQERAATSLARLVTGLGDLVLTPPLQNALQGVADVLRAAGHERTAEQIGTAAQQMASATGELAARSTRVKQARGNGAGSNEGA